MVGASLLQDWVIYVVADCATCKATSDMQILMDSQLTSACCCRPCIRHWLLLLVVAVWCTQSWLLLLVVAELASGVDFCYLLLQSLAPGVDSLLLVVAECAPGVDRCLLMESVNSELIVVTCRCRAYDSSGITVACCSRVCIQCGDCYCLLFHLELIAVACCLQSMHPVLIAVCHVVNRVSTRGSVMSLLLAWYRVSIRNWSVNRMNSTRGSVWRAVLHHRPHGESSM